ncbi:helix-turn-helix transcriptional regulator [Flavivirga eckloniae]|uniref:HTH araC/xylS-type domain-containing protein n=1 Tax=Flavivirga eckloniae TaxID=1803846 RepID=A0A2K9PSF9_9FLAO|nr:helix-turn-helix transcriptional regulator [Flavivirga eckloniae]AUP79996.1 hypothetical protein C1H87_15315 [Flavivirga eckloniae]
MKQKYFVYQLTYVNPLLKALKNSDISVEKLIKISKLHHFDLSDSQKYIPSEVLYDFLLLARSHSKTTNLIAPCYNYFKVSELGDHGDYISKLPILYQVLQQFIVHKSMFQTNTQNDLRIENGIAQFSFTFLDKYSAGRKIAENMYLAIILQTFQLFGGQNWIPLELHVPYRLISDIQPMLPKGEYIIRLNQKKFAILFSQPLLFKNRHTTPSELKKPSILGHTNRSFVTTIEKVLNSYKPGYIPSLKDLSNHFNTSESSIKRCLKSEKAKFSNILERILFKKAANLLSNSNLNIYLIGEHLGYSDSPNFIRSFKKWSGTTPGIYRNSMLKQEKR